MTEIKDFSRGRERVAFQIDGDVFDAALAIPAETLVKIIGQYGDNSEDYGIKEQYKALESVLELVLFPDSYALLKKRLTDQERPIDLGQLDEIVAWLIERYGTRPTQPSPDSSDGPASPASGTSSTAPAPVEVSTLPLSLPTAS